MTGCANLALAWCEPKMKMLWCWRCRKEMPMLDDEGYGRVFALVQAGAERRIRESLFGPVLDEYERITGYRETNPNAIFHHKLSKFGPPCSKCGKPLRTQRAKLCGSCHGSSRDRLNDEATHCVVRGLTASEGRPYNGHIRPRFAAGAVNLLLQCAERPSRKHAADSHYWRVCAGGA